MVVSGRVSSTLLHPAVSPKQLATSTWDLAKSQHIHPTLVVLLSSCRGIPHRDLDRQDCGREVSRRCPLTFTPTLTSPSQPFTSALECHTLPLFSTYFCFGSYSDNKDFSQAASSASRQLRELNSAAKTHSRSVLRGRHKGVYFQVF
ncbi:hypothetical protein E2C01_054201 [Portunus trituberculatus]|uniref:Uncharacterized protein n=1 Tax=Portunus trituberculatus TaxID=210409 RepID=A0A5B7GRB7_PORTR|nr:hypothetical protein [Portunus trituberculatus]